MRPHDTYMEQDSYEKTTIMDDLKEAAGVMVIGFCFIIIFVFIMSFIIARTRD